MERKILRNILGGNTLNTASIKEHTIAVPNNIPYASCPLMTVASSSSSLLPLVDNISAIDIANIGTYVKDVPITESIPDPK